MRIIGNIDHPTLKITAFQYDGKLSVKFEVGLMEQTFKFRENDRLKTFADLEKIIDATFIGGVLKTFQEMHKNREDAMRLYLRTADEDEFPVII
jgi:hypothetical protein